MEHLGSDPNVPAEATINSVHVISLLCIFIYRFLFRISDLGLGVVIICRYRIRYIST